MYVCRTYVKRNGRCADVVISFAQICYDKGVVFEFIAKTEIVDKVLMRENPQPLTLDVG